MASTIRMLSSRHLHHSLRKKYGGDLLYPVDSSGPIQPCCQYPAWLQAEMGDAHIRYHPRIPFVAEAFVNAVALQREKRRHVNDTHDAILRPCCHPRRLVQARQRAGAHKARVGVHHEQHVLALRQYRLHGLAHVSFIVAHVFGAVAHADEAERARPEALRGQGLHKRRHARGIVVGAREQYNAGLLGGHGDG